MRLRAGVLGFIAVLAAVALAVPVLALPWKWSEYTALPSQPTQALQRLQIHGRKGVAIFDSVKVWLTEDGGQTWGSQIDLKNAIGLKTGMQAQCCARRHERVAIGGIRFIAVLNAETNQWRTYGISQLPIEIMLRSNEDWGIRAIDIRTAPHHNQILAAGWKRLGDGPYRAFLMASNDAGETWNEFPLADDWPLLEGVILQDTPYLIGASGFLASLNVAGRKWERIKYPDFDKGISITGWYGRADTAWFGRSDGKVMKRQGDGDWEVFEVDPQIEDMEVAFRTMREGVVIGHDRYRHTFMYHTEDGGNTWERDSCDFDEWVNGPVTASTNDNVRYQAVIHLPGTTDIQVISKLLWRPSFLTPIRIEATRPGQLR
jgi:photosystem II stability/assembly factor-like uncharacterized protein